MEYRQEKSRAIMSMRIDTLSGMNGKTMSVGADKISTVYISHHLYFYVRKIFTSFI